MRFVTKLNLRAATKLVKLFYFEITVVEDEKQMQISFH